MRWSIERPILVRVLIFQFVSLLDRCARTRSPLWEVASSAYLVYIGARALVEIHSGALLAAYPRIYENLSGFMPLEWFSVVLVVLGAMQFGGVLVDERGVRAWMSFAALAAWLTLSVLFIVYSGTGPGVWIGVLFLLTAAFSFACAFALLVRGRNGRSD